MNQLTLICMLVISMAATAQTKQPYGYDLNSFRGGISIGKGTWPQYPALDAWLEMSDSTQRAFIKFKRSGAVRLNYYKNNAAGDSVLSTDSNGLVKLVAISSIGTAGYALNKVATTFNVDTTTLKDVFASFHRGTSATWYSDNLYYGQQVFGGITRSRYGAFGFQGTTLGSAVVYYHDLGDVGNQSVHLMYSIGDTLAYWRDIRDNIAASIPTVNQVLNAGDSTTHRAVLGEVKVQGTSSFDSGYIRFTDYGNQSGEVSRRPYVDVIFGRILGSAIMSRNEYFNTGTNTWLPEETTLPVTVIEAGNEGVTLGTTPAGSSAISTRFNECFQVRNTGAEALHLGIPTTGQWIQPKVPTIVVYDTTTFTGNDAHSWGGGTNPFLWYQSNYDVGIAGERRWIRFEQNSSTLSGAELHFLKSGGTLFSKSANPINDTLGKFVFEQYTGGTNGYKGSTMLLSRATATGDGTNIASSFEVLNRTTAGGAWNRNFMVASDGKTYIYTMANGSTSDSVLSVVNGEIKKNPFAGVTTGSQTWSGAKTLSSLATFSAGINVTGSTILSAGTLASDGSTKGLTLTATMPTSPSTTIIGNSITVTGAGSTSQTTSALDITYAAGYTGSGSNFVQRVINNTVGTGTGAATTSGNVSYRPLGNQGLQVRAEAPTAGNMIGATFLAGGGNVNIASWAASTAAKNGASNNGFMAFALNTGTGSTQTAGSFFLADYGSSLPTSTSAALLADNGSTTSPILVLRDNGTTVVSIVDGGTLNTQDVQPLTDNTYYLGLNSSTSPKAYKGLILKDTTNGNYYRIEVISGVITATAL